LEGVFVSMIQWLVPASLLHIRKVSVEVVRVEENSKVSYVDSQRSDSIDQMP
jgi:hypothetical protein